ncbi:MFS transporter [Sphingorhabdus sp. YGSMI21]|uniref:MFS transporter n=1 Tax=Sphingorhabdus sp. YGSMI21 TaxID=2077182 RepID=UPI000C1E1F5E|nr:MFS transporter [Sphingorhabdus sp. YGSMI21]ATW03379.1 MFS transporter [Sphingorhabdus sp. YGSMI21]
MSANATSVVWPRPASAWWMVSLLFLAGIFSVIDRAILNIVVDPVRLDLGISDVQIGLLQGLAFGVFYAFMGLPMGLLADRTSRKRLLVAGIAIWSIATIASGYATNFGELFAARLMVGLGEAALGPCAISLIADMFPPEKRGRPISIYMMGQGLANGIAISVTGLIIAVAVAGGFAAMPLIGDLAPWRTTFVICGAVGLLVALGLATTREPARQALTAVTPAKAALPGVAEAQFFWRNRGVFLPLYFAFAIVFLVAYGAGSWAPAMLMRGFGASPAFLGAWLGPFSIGFAAIGPLLGGYLLDRSMKSGKVMTRFRILSLTPLLAVPSALAVMVDNVYVATLLVASSAAVFSVVGTVMFATLQAIVPPQMRGSSISLTLILNTLIGAACGPLLIATVTEHVLGDAAQVGWSIAIVAIPSLLIGSALYAIAWQGMIRARLAKTETALLLDPALAEQA